MVRIMAGQGEVITAKPPVFGGSDLPSRSTTSASMPRNGRAADPGFCLVQASGVTRIIPVSVCHQVSMIGSLLPVTRRYQRQASGLIGSPTEPRILKLLKSYFFGHSS